MNLVFSDPTTIECLENVLSSAKRFGLMLSIFKESKGFNATYSLPSRRTKGNGRAKATTLGETLAILNDKMCERYQHPSLNIKAQALAKALEELFTKTDAFCFVADFGLSEPAPHGIRFHVSLPGRGYGGENPFIAINKALDE